jgi:hypothetical protein
MTYIQEPADPDFRGYVSGSACTVAHTDDDRLIMLSKARADVVVQLDM